MRNRPIGVFDSGVGGLTAVKELRKILPTEDIIYFGDTSRVPYGTRSAETIEKYAQQAIRYLASFNVKAILAACGTVSSVFSSDSYKKLGIDLPYITVVTPAVSEAMGATKNGKIGLMATSATVRSGSYEKAISAGHSSIKLTSVGCPILVTIIENGITQIEHPVNRSVLEMYLEPIKKAGVDTLILGCTHFPIVRPAITQLLGESVSIIDSGAAAARNLKTILEQDNLLSETGSGRADYYVTDTAENFVFVAQNFLSVDISASTKQVDIEIIDSSK